MINNRVILLYNLLAFSFTTNLHLRLTLKEFWLKPFIFLLLWPWANKNPCTSRDFLYDLPSFSSTQLAELSQLSTSSKFFQKHNFLERQISVVLSRDLAPDFFYSRWASPSNQSSRVVSTRLAVYFFLANIDRVERNLEALQLKTIKS